MIQLQADWLPHSKLNWGSGEAVPERCGGEGAFIDLVRVKLYSFE
jgi:hypothetical protein